MFFHLLIILNYKYNCDLIYKSGFLMSNSDNQIGFELSLAKMECYKFVANSV
jgi:hypothetical protein